MADLLRETPPGIEPARDRAPAWGRLLARPRPPESNGAVGSAAPAAGAVSERLAGLLSLPLGQGRSALLYVPEALTPGAPVRLVVTLHDAGGTAEQGMAPLRPFADMAGLILLAPESAGRTWDLIQDAFGTDVAALDRALEAVFARFPVDPTSVAIAGFSDGGSYALSLGLTNGDLFGSILAFSPGFLSPTARRGTPRVFVSHGAFDLVHPAHRGSRRIVPLLREAGCDAVYREYVGGHSLPAAVARAAVEWLVGHPIGPGGASP